MSLIGPGLFVMPVSRVITALIVLPVPIAARVPAVTDAPATAPVIAPPALPVPIVSNVYPVTLGQIVLPARFAAPTPTVLRASPAWATACAKMAGAAKIVAPSWTYPA